MSIDYFGNSPAMTEDEMIDAGLLTLAVVTGQGSIDAVTLVTREQLDVLQRAAGWTDFQTRTVVVDIRTKSIVEAVEWFYEQEADEVLDELGLKEEGAPPADAEDDGLDCPRGCGELRHPGPCEEDRL